MSSPTFLINSIPVALPGIQESSLSLADGTSYPLWACISITPQLPTPTPSHLVVLLLLLDHHTEGRMDTFQILFHPGDTQNTSAVSMNSYDLQAPRIHNHMALSLVYTFPVRVYIFKTQLFCIKLSPHRWNTCSSAQKEDIKDQAKDSFRGLLLYCLCFLCGICFITNCLGLLHSKHHLSHLSPPAPTLLTTTVPSDLRETHISTTKAPFSFALSIPDL